MAYSPRGTLAARQFGEMIDAMERVGVPVAAVLATCGLRRADLHSPLARVDAALDHELWTAAERLTGDPALSLRVGLEVARRGRPGVDMYIAINSGTLRDTLQNVERFAKLSDDRGHAVLLENESRATIRLQRDGGYPRAPGFVEALFAGFTATFSGRVRNFRLTAVQLRRALPPDVAPYVEAFGIAPCFGADTAELSFDRTLLDQPLAGSDATLVEILKEHAAELLKKVPLIDPVLHSVQTALFDGLERGQVGLGAIARATGTSTRTLRRRLSSLGTSFNQELDGLRRDLAVQRLRGGQDSIAQLAERLGFASPTAFQRAFRRWTGVTPSTFRQRERSG